MRLCCLLYAIPGWLRLVCGIAALALGLPLFILPIPVGLAVIAAGLTLTYSALPGRRRQMLALERRAPVVYRLIRPVVERCDRCPPPAR